MYRYNRIRLPEDIDTPFTKSIDQSQVWGTFAALFGLVDIERVVISYGSIADAVPASHHLENFSMVPTARPTEFAPLNGEGLYVLRTFNVLEAHVEEFVELSQSAWKTFEGSDDFAAGPKGLFRPAAQENGLVPMLLITWYDGLASWERSRAPDENARENFLRRRLLTHSTSALATRLIQT